MMNVERTLSVVMALIPLVLGIGGKISRISFSAIQSIGLMTIGLQIGGLVYMKSAFETEPSMLFLVGAVLLSGFCVILGQPETKQSITICATTLIILGLSLGALISQGLINRIFLSGLLGYATVFLTQARPRSLRTTIILLHMFAAILCSLGSVFSGQTWYLFAGLFLAATFLPLPPFHLPFVATVGAGKGTISSFWIVVWLTLGLAELQGIQSSLAPDIFFAIHLLALGSAVYASLLCLVQQQWHLVVAYATVAHVALVWGLLNVFSSYSMWGIPFGVAVAFVMSGLCITFSFVQQRYGWQTLGKLPGLASTMPRLGFMIILLVSFAMILPLFPTISGLMTMPTVVTLDVPLVMTLFMFLTVWLVGGWYFSQMLHQTVFGIARSDVPYNDLRIAEIVPVSALLLGATYCGVVY